MSLSPFASLEARVNCAVLSRLANADAVYEGGQPFGLVFDEVAAEDGLSGTSTAVERTASFDGVHAPGIVQGARIVIKGTTYIVSTDPVPDSSGWVEFQVYPE